MNKIIGLIILSFIFSGCTGISVKPVEKSQKMTHVCIKNNPKVIVRGFVGILENGFKKHHITTEIFTDDVPKHCEFYLEYTALRSWDVAPYLSHAELKLYKGTDVIGSAEYHLHLKGGLSLTKWKGTATKMEPVIDQLLAEY